MKFGFVLRQLTLTGPGVANAELRFTRGLNVIAGPSDTGKTFIAQCIDFAMGSGAAPKEIPEAAQYTSVLLEIESQDAGRIFVLERSLRGGDVRLSTQGEADRVLAAKHQADKEDTVSRFLLELSGLDGKKVRTNQQGKTRPLSFRDIAPLILVDEESVISATSPVLSGQYTTRTAESGVFLLAEANAPRKKERADGPSSIVSTGEAEPFSKEVEALLRSWHFPNLDRVTFSEDDQDIVISSRPRGSHGKGVRAITRAAFNLALLRLCARDSRPFPGVVLIDSPLVVYREPDTDEGAFPHDVKDAFYEAVAGAFGDVQVIILENDDPPDSVRATANVVAFTGTNQGRRGFIPQAAGVA